MDVMRRSFTSQHIDDANDAGLCSGVCSKAWLRVLSVKRPVRGCEHYAAEILCTHSWPSGLREPKRSVQAQP
jgi:hypothetical protein